MHRAPLSPAGDRIVSESRYYTIEYFDADGRRQRVATKCQDRDAAQQLANELERKAMLRREGIIDTKQERLAAEQRRPLGEHVAEYLAHLQAQGRTAVHVQQTKRQLTRLVELAKATTVADLTGATVQRVIGGLREREQGASLRTCNSYLRAIKSFTRWLWKEKRTADDSLAGLSAFNETTDRRHERRELQPDEMRWLLATTEAAEFSNYVPGDVRVMAYRVALGTGFRVNELRSLTPESFDLQSSPPTVTVAAAYSKRRRQDVQPIRLDLAEMLRGWLQGRPRGKRLFSLPHNTSKMLQRDLAAARAAWIADASSDAERQRRELSDFLQYRDAAGRVADFHALRHTYISGIVASGASVKVAQELARHSTPVLTIGRYSHARVHDLTGALDKLPVTHDAEPQAQRATGTDDATVRDVGDGGRNGGSKPAKSGPTRRNVANPPITRNAHADCPKVLQMNTLGDNRPDMAEVVRGGVEPPTHGFSVRCSTN